MKTIFLVGDSTVAHFDFSSESEIHFYPRCGFGMWLNRFFDGVIINNLALSGRSSKSFLAEKNYAAMTSGIKKGDYLLICFGHNDEKFNDPTRFTFGGGKVGDIKSFKFYLYNFYIKHAQKSGAVPILCTPIVRRSPVDCYADDCVHIIDNAFCEGISYPKSDYANSIRELADQLSINMIDLTDLTKKLFLSLGASKSRHFMATFSKDPNDTDNTHLNALGAGVVASILAKELKKIAQL